MRQVIVGDQSSAVDQLIASCQAKAPAGSNYQGFGRDLVPFDFEQHDVAPGKPCMMGALEDGKKARRGSPKSYKVVTKKVQPLFAKAEPQQQAQQSRSPRRQAKKQADEASYPTAPGFSQSPKPEAVPLPTMFLLRKALAKSVELCNAVTHEQPLASLTAVRVAAV